MSAMSDSADWPGKTDFPYVALIRIRYVHELEVLLIRQLQHAIRATATPAVSAQFEAATTRIALGRLAGPDADRTEISDAQRGAAFVAFDPDGPICPDTPQEMRAAIVAWLIAHGVHVPPIPDPDPNPWYLGGDLAMVVLAARDAVAKVASKQIAEQLNTALNGVVDAALRSELGQQQRTSVSI
jgi:hypothetical protein